MAKSKDANPPLPETAEGNIELSVPWLSRLSRGNTSIQRARYMYPANSLKGGDIQESFLQRRSGVHELYIRETERTRRLGLWLAAGLIALASLLPVFAPPGRETLSFALSGGLVVFAAGAVGMTRVKIRFADQKIETSTDRPN